MLVNTISFRSFSYLTFAFLSNLIAACASFIESTIDELL
jgi:hypothetical protein